VGASPQLPPNSCKGRLFASPDDAGGIEPIVHQVPESAEVNFRRRGRLWCFTLRLKMGAVEDFLADGMHELQETIVP
jgi:hypothetical protein